MKLDSGKFYELKIKKGSEATRDYSERIVRGKVVEFDHIDRVYDAEGIAIKKKVEKKWEVQTGDPLYPAIGFLPNDVIEAKPIKMN